MTAPNAEPRSIETGRLLRRWALLLAGLAVFMLWSTHRLNRTVKQLEHAAIQTGSAGGVEPAIEFWTCTMHPDIMQPGPGKCPKCGMKLLPRYAGSDEPGVKPVVAVTGGVGARPTGKTLYMCTMPECNDTPSADPNSRCPVCGMKREAIVQDDAAESPGKYEITLGERARRLAGLATEPVRFRSLWKRIRTVGKVTYDETRHKMVTTWNDGRIDKLFADYTGMVVSKGDHLVEIYSPDLVTAQAGLLGALRSQEKLRTSTSPDTRERAERTIRSAERQLELLGITEEQIKEIKRTGEPATHLVTHAPIGGTIVRKNAMEGMYVRTGDMLYEIADLTHVWLLLDLYESDLPWVRPFQRVTVTAESLPGEAFEGRIAFVDPVVDKISRTIKVRVHVDNPELRLKPEMFVNAEIEVALTDTDATPSPRGAYACPMHPWETADTRTTCPLCEMNMVRIESIPGHLPRDRAGKVLGVPREAVLKTGRRALVYIEVLSGVYRSAEIDVGPLAVDTLGREFYPVPRGLREGQRVVTRGNFAIDSQMQLSRKRSLFNPEPTEPGGRSAVTAHRHSEGH